MDVFSTSKRSQVMRRIRSKDSQAELSIRKALFERGFRFRLHDRTLEGCPDLVLRKFKSVIQVRGCFWHGHCCKDGHFPKSRGEYWIPKIEGNKIRDARNDESLRRRGWNVIVVWECEC